MAKAWCKHYRGMYNKTQCEAGVAFAALPGAGTKEFMKTCPCFGPATGCEKAEYPTAEELAAEDERRKRNFENIVKAREAIVKHLGGPWKKNGRGKSGSAGVIDCPVCKTPKSLGFRRSGYNGHIHAQCATDGCVKWME